MTTTHRRVLGAGIAATAIAALVAGTPAWPSEARHQGQPEPDDGAAAVVQRLPRPPRGAPTAPLVRRPRTRRRRPSAAPSTSRPSSPSCATKAGDANEPHRRRRRPHRRLDLHLGHVPRRAVGRVAQRDGPRRQQRRQPRVRRGHRPSCCACRTAAATRSTAATSPTSRTPGRDFQWLAANVVKKDGGGTLLPGDLGQGRRRHQGRLHRHDPRGHPDAGQPGRRRVGRLQGRGRDRQRAGGAAEEAGREGDRRAAARGRLQRGTVQRAASASPSPDRADRRADDAPRSTRSSRVTPTTPTSAPSPTRPATRASSPAPPTTAGSSPRPTSSSTPRAARSTAADHRDRTTSSTAGLPRTRPDGDHRQVEHPGRSAQGPRSSGTHTEAILGDCQRRTAASRRRWPTSSRTRSCGAPRAARVARRSRFMNVGGVRATCRWRRSYGEASGQITFAEAYDIAPFGNLLVTRRPHRRPDPAGARAAVPADRRPWLAADAGARCVRRLHLRPGTPPTRRVRASSPAR